MPDAIRFAVLTVSDTASVDSDADKSGPVIVDMLCNNAGYTCESKRIVPDDLSTIRSAVQTLCGGDVAIDWVITTGGTGFGVRDVTPEAIHPLIERHAPGLVHLLISTSLKHTPLGSLSRPIAGTINKTLVVTLPGSVKAVRENLQSLLDGGVVQHAIDLIRGGTGKTVHSALASTSLPDHHSANRQHYHHHHHQKHNQEHQAPVPRSHDPSLSASARHRESPYPIISFAEAIDVVLDNVKPLDVHVQKVTHKLQGHILAEDVYAPQDVPNSPTTSVDGYALRSTDPPGTYVVVTSSTHSTSTPLPASTIYRINTGGPLPVSADTVIMVEDTKLVSTHEGVNGLDGEENEVATLAQIPTGENVRQPGSDVHSGDLVLQRGDMIHSTGGEIGTLAFVGRKEVSVYKKPIVAILSTGNEIVDLHSTSVAKPNGEWGGIWDTNRPSLHAALSGMGYDVIDLGVVRDEVEAHVEAIKKGLASADILLTTGGTSMGPTDLLKPVIERHFKGTVHFGRVAIKPGKPTTFATVPDPSGGGRAKPIFALPGNPASAMVTFHVFVVPALRKLGGWPHERCQLSRVPVKLEAAMVLDSRMEFLRVVVKVSGQGLLAVSTGGQRSSRVASLSGANGFVVLPPKETLTPKTTLEAGAMVDAVIIGEIGMV